MKFSITSTANTARLGLISNIVRLPDFEIQTPHAFLYTKGGTVPHLSYEVLQMVTNENQGLKIPIPNLSYLQDRIKLSKQDVAEFIGMKEYLSYCGFIDPGEKRVPGFHEKDKISVWTRCGRYKYTAASYMEFMEYLKPDMFLLLADGDTDFNSTQKRVGKSFNNTVTLFEKCMEIYKESTALESSQVIGVIEGGFDLTLREKSSKLIGESSVFGVLVDGLHDYGEAVCDLTSADIKNVIEMSLKHIPHHKLKIIHGSWNPSVVLELVELGIDMFDTSYPTFISDHGGALIFPNTISLLEQKPEPNGLSIKKHFSEKSDVISNDAAKSQEDKSGEPALKRFKLRKASKFHISLSDNVYATDFTPILEDCTCLTCKNHTKAYIHHLITVDELLGATLLMIHNLHHYFLFMSTIREALKSGKFQIIKQNFESGFDKLDKL